MGELDGVVKGLAGAWVERGTLTGRWGAGPPLSCREEVVGVVGFGRLGRRIARLCEGVGMGRVVVAGRKKRMGELDGEVNGMGVAGELNGDVVHRVPFEDVLRMVTVLVICCPRHASTIDLIGEEELRMMRQEAIVINVARGGIVNEAALAKALTDGWIAAAATDVLEKEPGGRGTTPLLPLEGEVPNLTITPHVAWYSAQTMKNLKTVLKEGIEAWIAGMPINVVVQGR